MVGPALAQDVLDPSHVGSQLPVDLLGPDDRAGHRRQIPDVRHLVGLGLEILDLEFLVQSLDVILDPLYQLGLVFSDGAPDMRPDKEGVES